MLYMGLLVQLIKLRYIIYFILYYILLKYYYFYQFFYYSVKSSVSLYMS